VLQRSWTIGQDERGEEAAEDESVPGAVYVGRASFRMVNMGAVDPSVASHSNDVTAGGGAMEAVRTPTERVVLVAGSLRQRRSFEKGNRRRPLSLLFGAAFGVGVMCTLAGQVVLHSREKQRIAGQMVGEIAGGTAASETFVTTPTPVAQAATPQALAPRDEPETEATSRGEGMLVADRSADVSPGDLGASAAVASENGIGMRKFKAHTSRRAAKGMVNGGAPNHHASAGSGADWIDPFSAGGEAAFAAKRPETRAQPARRGQESWVDPFAE
jgi:hypothetical protein